MAAILPAPVVVGAAAVPVVAGAAGAVPVVIVPAAAAVITLARTADLVELIKFTAAGFNRGEPFQGKRAIHQTDRLAGRNLFGPHNRQLTLGLRVLQDTLAGGLGKPLNDHVDVGSLEAQLNAVGGSGRICGYRSRRRRR